jgi:hypothetical protein
VYWHTAASVSKTTYTGYVDVTAGAQGVAVVTGLTNSTNYYFAVTAFVDASEGTSSSAVGPVPAGAVAGGYSVSGQISFSGLTATGPLYVVVYRETGSGPVLFTTRVASPSSPQAYTITGVTPGTYQLFAFFDMDSDGEIDPTDPSLSFRTLQSVTVSAANVTGLSTTIASTNALADLTTDHRDTGMDQYNLQFEVGNNRKMVTKAAITAGPLLALPVDLPLSSFDGGRFRLWRYLGGSVPSAGQQYTVDVTYSDSTTELVYLTVTGVVVGLPTANTPSGTTANGQPTFTWTAPSSLPGSYTYRLEVQGSGGGNHIWEYEGIPSGTTSVAFNADGSADQDPLPSGSYQWRITVVDAYGNRGESADKSFTVP